MTAAALWLIGSGAVLAVLLTLYLIVQLNAVRNEQVINAAITVMCTAIGREPAPQRALLRAVADTLVAQDRAVARIETTVHELALRRSQSPELPLPLPEDLIKELLDLPEPQALVTDFLGRHGGPSTGTAFFAIGADVLETAIAEVFADLAQERSVELERMLDIGADGTIASVALAGLEIQPLVGLPPFRAPRVADLDRKAMATIVLTLDKATRQQLRLATLLHGQAEALLRIHPGKQRVLARIRGHLHQVLRLPLVRRLKFSRDDLAALVVAFDVIGEVIDAATEQLANGEPARAIQLLAELVMPVPSGLPGRIFHQESLAHARPTASFGVWHRLAVARWLASSMAAITEGLAASHWFGDPSSSPPDHGGCDPELALGAKRT